jgi:hypothetical protein
LNFLSVPPATGLVQNAAVVTGTFAVYIGTAFNKGPERIRLASEKGITPEQ